MDLMTRRAFLATGSGLALGAGTGPAEAATGSVSLTIVSAGFILGAAGGKGVLRLGGRRYALNVGGISVGATFGASRVELFGTASRLRRASDIAGVYSKVGAGASMIHGDAVADLVNTNGVTLRLRGRQTGIMVSIDLSGMTISMA